MSVDAQTSSAPAQRVFDWQRVTVAIRSQALGLILLLVVLPLPFVGAALVNSPTPALQPQPAALLVVRPAGQASPLSDNSAELQAALPPSFDAADDGSGGRFEASTAPVGAVVTTQVQASAEADDRLNTLELLLSTTRPARDPIAMASRLAGELIPWVATGPSARPSSSAQVPAQEQVAPPSTEAEAGFQAFSAGRRDTFFVLDQTDNQYKARPATLRLVSRHAYWYVQDDESVDEDGLAAAAFRFDERTVPTVRRIFGSEWTPGIDGDPRVTIFLGLAPGVGAYFSSWDEYPRSVYRYSNEREMIHVNVRAARPGSSGFDGTIAHELQHMVHWHQNPQDDTWIDEGFAELASSLAVPGRQPGTSSFERQPNIQLTAWSQGSQTGIHYQAAYLFSRYFAQRFGEEAIGQLLREPGRPPDTITAFLSRSGYGVTFEDVFEDWIVANLLDDPAVGDGRYAHDDIEHTAWPTLTLRPDGQPVDGAVRQFGAEYLELAGDGADAELTFAGSPTVQLVDADATSGQGVWWTNRADGMDSTLTRRFDLTEVSSATLRFNLWYDTEADFDFLYVLASTDGGTRWQVLHGAAADDANPTGNAIGPGYSGRSGTAGSRRSEPSWIAETVDLTPLAGSDVMIRFEYVTDQGYNARGALLDDIEVPEIGFRDDAEADAGWTAAGFLRSNNVIPQTWSLQLIEHQRGGETHVRALRVDADGRLVERLPGLGGEIERAVLVVSGLAPRTLEPAPYQVTLRPTR